jgi:Tol biopolymer transport system component
MPLTQGIHIGPYEIDVQIGVGGMGEVYRATDTNLKRQVAIKVLPAAVANDADRLARFQREAQLLAALSHPNIAIVHGLEKGDSVTALVMELVEGSTLADRIARGALPVVEALAIAKQIAEALEAADAQGIVHRDLKPANVKVRPDGTAKVLDFGLAKALERVPSADIDVTASPTVTSPAVMTGAGVLLGTAAYMSPEQARGKTVDKRSDIWAFGCVLYEMLTARPAFSGDSVVDILSAIVSREPDWTQLPVQTPPGIRRLMQRCLAKDVKRRLHDIADARIEIEDALHGGENVPETGARGRIGGRAAAMIAIAFLAVGVATGKFLMQPQAANATHASQTVRYTMPIDGLAPGSTPVISRDGRQIAIVGSKPGGSSAIWVLSLDGERPKELPGTSGAASPFWSPDGRSLGFFADGAIRRVDLSGGPVQRIARAEETLGGAWSSSGTIVFSERYALFQVPASGGTPALVASLDLSRQENSLRLPEFLPDGRHFLYLARSGRPDNSGAYLASIDGGAPKRILNTRWPVRYVSPDTLLYVRDDVLLAQSFDIERGTLSGTPRQIVGPIDPNLPTSDFYGASDTGTLVYRLLPPQVSQLAWVARDGAMGSALGQPTNVSNFRISPEERRIVFDEADRGSRSVWTLDIGTGGRSRLTFPGSDDWQPIWSPDGLRIMFGSYRNGPIDMYSKLADGGGNDQEFMVSSIQKGPRDWSKDGRFVLYTQDSPETKEDLYAREASGNVSPVTIAATAAREFDGRFSGDRRWVSYVSNETGMNEVFVQPFPPTGGKWQVSSGGALSPRWREDGRELFYLTPQGEMKVVSVDGARSFSAGPAHTLFHLEGVHSGLPGNTAYEVTRNGERFLVNFTRRTPPDSSISVILNWAASQ